MEGQIKLWQLHRADKCRGPCVLCFSPCRTRCATAGATATATATAAAAFTTPPRPHIAREVQSGWRSTPVLELEAHILPVDDVCRREGHLSCSDEGVFEDDGYGEVTVVRSVLR